MRAIADGAPMSDAARLAVANALYPEFVNGAIGGQAALESDRPSTHNGFHVSKADMEKVFAELMKTDQSRAALEKGIHDYAANELAKAIATGENFEGTCQKIGSLLGVVTVAARDYIHDKAKRDDFVLGILGDAGHIAVGVASKYTGPAAPIAGAAGDHLVDKAVGDVDAGKQAKAATEQRSFDDKVKLQEAALLAKAYYDLPQYRALAPDLPAGLRADPNDPTHLKDIGAHDADDFSDWLKDNPRFASAIAGDERTLDVWIHDQLLRG